ncbi:MAG: 50S ribosomal protein L14e [Candidatus Heimdallarchaeota archaeon]
MATFEIGRIAVKTAGREAAQKAVIIDFIDSTFVLITGAGISKIKRRRANMKHLEPTTNVLEIKKGASDSDIQKALEAAGLTEDFAAPVTPEF